MVCYSRTVNVLLIEHHAYHVTDYEQGVKLLAGKILWRELYPEKIEGRMQIVEHR
jgi:hypothetical protein